MYLEFQSREMKHLQRVEFPADLDSHVVAARVGVGEVQDDHRPAVFVADLRHLEDHGVGDAAGRQIQVAAVFLRDGGELGVE